MVQNAWSRASEVQLELHDAHRDSKRPIFHPLAPRGWSSDPCGPVFFRGRYHLFYQHQPATAQWSWGLCWDHVVSDDLIHWKNLPPAVVPTPGGLDADGCFSGTVEVDPELGVPVILYTGVYLKTNAESVAAHGLPDPQHDPGTRFVEKQLAAVPADPNDPDLTYWVKLPSPVMPLPPAGLNISCWRDPFCLKRPAAAGGEGDEWVVLLASGIRGVGGAVLRFRSKHFTHGWVFDGVLAAGEDTLLGQDWECPILAQLPQVSKAAATAAIAVSTAAIPAAIAAKLPEQLTLGTAGLKGMAAVLAAAPTADSTSPIRSSSSSSSSVQMAGGGGSQAAPATPRLRGVSPTAATSSSSLSSFSGLGGSSTSLAATAATADDTASQASGTTTTGSSSPTAPAAAAPVSCCYTGSAAGTAGTGSTSASAALAAAAAIAAAGHATVAAVAEDPVPAAEAAGGCLLALPLTEPALAAATSAADAAPISSSDATLTHPAVSVDAWVECQTQQRVQSAAAATAAASPPAAAEFGSSPSSDDVLCLSAASADDLAVDLPQAASSAADLTVLITADQETASVSSSTKQQQQQQQLAAPGNSTSTSSLSSSSDKQRWWFCMSPEACNNPITWWLGEYDGRSFDVSAADGPHRLDLGTTLYAATLWQDPQGHQLLYGWIQEHRRVPTPPALVDAYSYAGCISTPRVLQLVEGRLWQTPLPEINALRTSVCWRAQDLLLCPGDQLTPLRVVSGTHLDVNLTLLPPAPVAAAAAAAAAAQGSGPVFAGSQPQAEGCLGQEAGGGSSAGLVFKSWKPDGKGAAVLSFHWESGLLLFDFDEPFPDAYNPHPVDTPDRRRVGGRLKHYTPGEPLALRILLDGSAVEVFTSTGETLTTRLYRGHPPKCKCAGCCPGAMQAATATTAADGSSGTAPSGCSTPPAAPPAAVGDSAGEAWGCGGDDETGIALFAAGAAVTVSELCVWEMGSCWVPPSSPPPQPPPALLQQQLLAASRQASAAAGGSSAPGAAGTAWQPPPAGSTGVLPPTKPAAAAGPVTAAATRALSAGGADGGSAGGSAGGLGPSRAGQALHQAAGEQAVVQEAFLEELHIHAK